MYHIVRFLYRTIDWQLTAKMQFSIILKNTIKRTNNTLQEMALIFHYGMCKCDDSDQHAHLCNTM